MGRRANLSLFNVFFRLSHPFRQSPIPAIPFTHPPTTSKFLSFSKITSTHFAIRHPLRSFSGGHLDHTKEVDTIKLLFAENWHPLRSFSDGHLDHTRSFPDFGTYVAAIDSITVKNFTPLDRKQDRIVLVKNLDKSFDNKKLHDTFALFGTVLSCKVETDSNGQSKRRGFVQFDNEEAAQNAMEQLNGMLINDKQLYVGAFDGPYAPFLRDRVIRADGSPEFTNVYVKNFPETYTDDDLRQLFGPHSSIIYTCIMGGANGKSRCGYVYFDDPDSAAAAVEKLNGTTVNGDRVLCVRRAQTRAEREAELNAKCEGFAKLVLKNLDCGYNVEMLKDLFSKFGTITSCKVATESNDQSKGYGFVQFDDEESAQNAMERLNGMLINDKQVYVGPFRPKFTNVYVRNFPTTYTDDDLKQLFAPHGRITSAAIMRDDNGKPRNFGFVKFQSPDSAAAAVEKLNGTTVGDDRVLYVARAQRKAERKAELKAKIEGFKTAKLIVKQLDRDYNDEMLKDLFSGFGTITSCEVMRNSKGRSIGQAFVIFSTAEEASEALYEMDGKLIGKKALCVKMKRPSKEERKRLLRGDALL